MRIILETEKGCIDELNGNPSHFMQGDIVDTTRGSFQIEYRRLIATFHGELNYMYLIVKERKRNG